MALGKARMLGMTQGAAQAGAAEKIPYNPILLEQLTRC